MSYFESIAVVGAVISVQRNTGPGDFVNVTDFPPEGVDTADKISYTIQYNDPASGVVTVTRVVPINARYRPPLKIVPAMPGSGVIGVRILNILQFTIHEMPGMVPCVTAPGDTDGVCCFGTTCISQNTSSTICAAMGGTWIPNGSCSPNPCVGGAA